jgi:hypothetical protein
VAEERRLAMAMAVVSQVHIANMNFVQSRQDYRVAEEYLDVSKRLTKQTRDAQKVAKFGELEVIRQEASLLLANLRRDIAFAELQNSFSTVYASVGLDVVPNQLEDMSIAGLSHAITQSLKKWGLKYKSVVGEGQQVTNPIANQNPMLKANGFVFAANTFDIGKPVKYSIGMQDGTALPDWVSFDSDLRKISGVPPKEKMQLSLRVIAQGPKTRITDSFVLRLDDAKNGVSAKRQKTPAAAPVPITIPVTPESTSAPILAPTVAPLKAPTAPKAPISTQAPKSEPPGFVQAKALNSRAKAQKFSDKIKNTVGLQSFVRKTKRLNPPMYRVIIPAFSSDDVPSIMQALERVGVRDAFMTRY